MLNGIMRLNILGGVERLTDTEVNSWATKVQTYNPSYGLMLKHWDTRYLSNARPSNVMFVTDTQQLGSLSSATSEYVAWVDHYSPAQVGFQIGYLDDLAWWGSLADPASSIINPIIIARPNVNIGGVYWVDFSALKIFPTSVDSTTQNITISDITRTEGNSGTKSFSFTITRSTNTASASVQYSTASNTATSPSDYTAIPLTTLNLPAGGSLTKTVRVPVVGDTAVEPNETFTVNLSNCVGCTITDNQGVGTITNDDSSTASSITINDVTLTEGNSSTKNFAFTIKRSSNINSVSVNYYTVDNTATVPVDYTAKSTTVTLPAGGSLTQTVTVPVVGDTAVEPNETFTVNLSNCVGCTITDNQGVGTITNDDSSTASSITINDVTLTEGNSGTKSFHLQ